MKTNKKILLLSATMIVSTFSSLSLLTKLDANSSKNITTKISSFKAYDDFNEFSDYDAFTFIHQTADGYNYVIESSSNNKVVSSDQVRMQAIFFNVFALHNHIIKYITNNVNKTEVGVAAETELNNVKRNYINLKYNLLHTSKLNSISLNSRGFKFTGTQVSDYVNNELPKILNALDTILDFQTKDSSTNNLNFEEITKYFESLIKIKNIIPDFWNIIRDKTQNIVPATYAYLYSTKTVNIGGGIYGNGPALSELLNADYIYADGTNLHLMVSNILDIETYRTFAEKVDANFLIKATKSYAGLYLYKLSQKDIFKNNTDIFFNNLQPYKDLALLAKNNLLLHKDSTADDLEYVTGRTNTANITILDQWQDFSTLQDILAEYNTEYERLKLKITNALKHLASYDKYNEDLEKEINDTYDEAFVKINKLSSIFTGFLRDATINAMNTWREKLFTRMINTQGSLINILRTKSASVQVSVNDLNRLSSTVKTGEVNVITDGSYSATVESIEPSDGSLKVNLILKISSVTFKTSKNINGFQTQAEKEEAERLADLEKLKSYARSFSLFVGNKARLSKDVKIDEIDIEKGPEFEATIESITPKDGTLDVDLLLTLNNAQYRVTKEISGFYTQAKQDEVDLNKLITKGYSLSVDVDNKNRLSSTVIENEINITKDNTYTAIIEKIEYSDGKIKVFLKLTLRNAVHKITKDILGFKTLAQDNVEKLISAAEESVNNASETTESSQSKINAARTAYKALPFEQDDLVYAIKLDHIQDDLNLKDATKKVTDLETVVQADNFATSKVDEDLVIAKTAINKLRNDIVHSTQKENLNNRINLIEQKNNALKTKLANQADVEAKINQAIASVADPNSTTGQSQELIDQAQEANDKLEDGELKTQNQAKIDKAQADLNLKDANKKVGDLETLVKTDNFDTAKVDTDLIIAKVAIDKVKDATDKTNLNNKINLIEQKNNALKTKLANQTDAENKINLAIASVADPNSTTEQSQELIDQAQQANDKLEDGDLKTQNQVKIDKAQADLNLKDANKKVADLETIVQTDDFDTSKVDADLIVAKTAIDKVKDSTDKTSLNNRINLIEQKNNALKTKLANQADAENKINQAIASVADPNSTTEQSQELINQAQQANNKLEDGELKTQNQAKIDKAQSDLELKDANKKVADLETIVQTDNFDTAKVDADLIVAKAIVDKIKDTTAKVSLNNRLNNVEQKNNALKIKSTKQADVENKINLAVASVADPNSTTGQSQELIDQAQEANDKLEDGELKTQNQGKIDKVQVDLNLKDANKQVTDLEDTVKNKGFDTLKVGHDLEKARNAVDILKNGKEKDKLTSRIDKLQSLLENKEPLLNKETTIAIIVLSVLLVGTLGAIIFLLKGK